MTCKNLINKKNNHVPIQNFDYVPSESQMLLLSVNKPSGCCTERCSVAELALRSSALSLDCLDVQLLWLTVA